MREISWLFDRLFFEITRRHPARVHLLAAHEFLVEAGAVGGGIFVKDFAVAEHARIVLGLELGFHAFAQLLHALGVHGFTGEVVGAITASVGCWSKSFHNSTPSARARQLVPSRLASASPER